MNHGEFSFTAVFTEVPEGGYAAYVEEVPVKFRLKKTSTIPRHREIRIFPARKICKDLDILILKEK